MQILYRPSRASIADGSVVPAPAAVRPRSVRDRIIDAAREAFRRNGIAATPLDDVAALAGVARPNLYRYFADREELAAVQHEYWGPLLEYGRARREIAAGLSNERIVRWFLINHVSVSERPELIPNGDVRTWFADFVVPPVLAAAGGIA